LHKFCSFNRQDEVIFEEMDLKWDLEQLEKVKAQMNNFP